MVELVSDSVPLLSMPPPWAVPAPVPAVLPLMVQSISAVFPELNMPPPALSVWPPLIVRPEIDAVTPGSTWNTRLALLPETVTPAAGPVIVSVPVVSLSSSWAAVQGNRLRRGEDGRVEVDRLGRPG